MKKRSCQRDPDMLALHIFEVTRNTLLSLYWWKLKLMLFSICQANTVEVSALFSIQICSVHTYNLPIAASFVPVCMCDVWLPKKWFIMVFRSGPDCKQLPLCPLIVQWPSIWRKMSDFSLFCSVSAMVCNICECSLTFLSLPWLPPSPSPTPSRNKSKREVFPRAESRNRIQKCSKELWISAELHDFIQLLLCTSWKKFSSYW